MVKRLVGTALIVLCVMSISAEDGVQVKIDGAIPMWIKSKLIFDLGNRATGHRPPASPWGYNSLVHQADLVHKRQEGTETSQSYNFEAWGVEFKCGQAVLFTGWKKDYRTDDLEHAAVNVRSLGSV